MRNAIHIHWVSFALDRLKSTNGAASLGRVRDLIASEFGPSAAAVSDAEIRAALLELSRSPDRSSSVIRPGTSVTCSPMPEGWIPLDEFRLR